jgi:hypothetical protein
LTRAGDTVADDLPGLMADLEKVIAQGKADR